MNKVISFLQNGSSNSKYHKSSQMPLPPWGKIKTNLYVVFPPPPFFFFKKKGGEGSERLRPTNQNQFYLWHSTQTSRHGKCRMWRSGL